MEEIKEHKARPELVVRERCKDCGVFLGYRKLSTVEKNDLMRLVEYAV